MRNHVYIGLGGNVGLVVDSISKALQALDSPEHTTIIAVSSLYTSEPWGKSDQPEFVNAVAHIDTRLRADELLGVMQDIEASLGRAAVGPKNGPRPIDLDILLFGNEEWETLALEIPHPRMAERDFVITPLLEIAPDITWPSGEAITRDAVAVGRVTGTAGRVPGFEDRLGALPEGGAPDRLPKPEGPRPTPREPHPGEEWTAVYEYGADPQLFLGLLQGAAGFPAPLTGRQPDVRAYFAQVVVEQLGIPYEWDPFPPGQATDPYGFTRRFRLVVPSSMAAEAAQAIADADNAPIDWSECDLGPEDQAVEDGARTSSAPEGDDGDESAT